MFDKTNSNMLLHTMVQMSEGIPKDEIHCRCLICSELPESMFFINDAANSTNVSLETLAIDIFLYRKKSFCLEGISF